MYFVAGVYCYPVDYPPFQYPNLVIEYDREKAPYRFLNINGTRDFYTPGTVATFSCDNGNEPIGVRSATCNDYAFKPIPTCHNGKKTICVLYRSGTVNSNTVNSNTVNSKFHLIRIFYEVSVNIFSIISCLICTVNSNFHLI